MDDTEIYINAIGKWGIDAQVCMVMEECGELIQACNKYLRAKNHGEDMNKAIDGLCVEIADVEIMLGQLRAIVNDNLKIYRLKKDKLNKILKRLCIQDVCEAK